MSSMGTESPPQRMHERTHRIVRQGVHAHANPLSHQHWTIAVIALLPALAVTTPAVAQRLNLDTVDQAPSLPERNAASMLAAALAQEVEHLAARSRAEDGESRSLEASIAWRRLAHELLVRGDDPSNRCHDLVVAGFRLADARGEFDRSIDRLPAAGVAGAAPAREALERFIAAPAELRAAPMSELRASLARALAGLDPVLEVLSLPRAVNPWPAMSGTPGTESSSDRGADQVATAAADPTLPPELAASLNAVAEQLRAAEEWPDLRPEAIVIAQPLLRVPAGVAIITSASWLPVSLRDSLQRRWIESVDAMASPADRDRGVRDLAQLDAVAKTVETATTLVRPRQPNAPRGPIDPARVVKTLTALAAPAADAASATSAVERLRMVEALLRTMVEVRTLEVNEVRRELRTLRRDLTRDALRAEEPVLRQVETLAAPSAHPTDPAFASLLESQRRRVRAIQALDGIDRALTEIEARLPVHAKPLVQRWRSTLPQLADAQRSEQALLRCEAFLADWRRVRELPVEMAIRRGDPAVVELAAGRAPELLGALDRRREAWAAAWGEGNAEAASAAVAPIIALFDLINDAAALTSRRTNPRLLGRWGGWDDLGGIPGATDAMDARVAIAVEALARGDDAALREALALQAREAPLWRLRTRLLRLLADELEALPEGVSGAIGRASGWPEARALLAPRAQDLFTLSRFAREYLRATSAGDRDEADRLHAFIRSLATDLLRDLDASAVGTTPMPRR